MEEAIKKSQTCVQQVKLKTLRLDITYSMALVFESVAEVCRDRGYPCSFSFGYRMCSSDAVAYRSQKQALIFSNAALSWPLAG